MPWATVPSAPAPLPVVPLSYADSAVGNAGALPGRLIAIGVISIFLGVLGMVMGIRGTAEMYQGYSMSVPPPPPPPLAAPPPPPSNLVPHDGDFVRPAGLKAADRAAVLAAVAERVELSPDRRLMLERFLADAGADLFTASPGTPLTNNAALAQLTEAVQSPIGPNGTGLFGTHFITTARGSMEVDNSSASFIDTANRRRWTLDGNILTDHVTTRPMWGAAALNEWVETVRGRMYPAPVTAFQATVLLREAAQAPPDLSRDSPENFGFLPVPDQVASVSGFYNAAPGSGSTILVARVNGQDSYVLPDGRVARRAVYRWGFDPTTWAPNQRPEGISGFTPMLPGSLSAMKALVVEGVVTTLVSVLLLLAGAYTVAKLRGSARRHKAWAVLKVPQVVASVALGVWYISSIEGPAAEVVSRQMAPVIIGVALSGAYPVIVWLVLSSRASQAYYKFRDEATELLPLDRRQRLAGAVQDVGASASGRAALWGAAAVAAVIAVGHVVSGFGQIGRWSDAAAAHVVGAGLMVAAAAFFLAAAAYFARGARAHAAEVVAHSTRKAART